MGKEHVDCYFSSRDQAEGVAITLKAIGVGDVFVEELPASGNTGMDGMYPVSGAYPGNPLFYASGSNFMFPFNDFGGPLMGGLGFGLGSDDEGTYRHAQGSRRAILRAEVDEALLEKALSAIYDGGGNVE